MKRRSRRARLRERAENGDARAMYALAMDLVSHAPIRRREARELVHQAAKRGYVRAQKVQAQLEAYEKSHDAYEKSREASAAYLRALELDYRFPRRSREAVRWYRKAAESGHAAAQFELGHDYSEGIGVRANARTAAYWYRKAGQQGHRDALYNLGHMYRSGEAVQQSWPRALECFRGAATLGHDDAFYWLVEYYEGRCGPARNARLATEWLRRAQRMARRGHANVCAFLGEYYGGKDADLADPRAIGWLRLGATKNDEWSLVCLGCHHANGAGVKKDSARAVQLYRRAVALGSDRACYLLGRCYQSGDGVRRDRRRARAWFRRAAEGGEKDARRELAELARARRQRPAATLPAGSDSS